MVFLDGSRIATTGMGGLVSIWDVRTGHRLGLIDPLPEDEFASTIEYSLAARKLLIGTSGGRVLVTTLNDNTADALVSLADQIGYVWDLQFSRDGNYFASASLMPMPPSEEETAVDPIDDTAEGLARSQVGERPAPPNVVIWDAERREKVGELEGTTGVQRMALVPGRQALLTVGENVDIWTFLSREQLEELSDPSMALQSIGIGTLAVISVVGMTMGGMPNMSFGESMMALAQFPMVPTTTSMRYGCARAAAISPDGRTIVSTTRGPSHNVMAVIDRSENSVIEKWTIESSVCDLQFSHDGKHLVAATSRGVFIFDTTLWKKVNLKELIRGDASG
jgi:WD40 repeat protein